MPAKPAGASHLVKSAQQTRLITRWWVATEISYMQAHLGNLGVQALAHLHAAVRDQHGAVRVDCVCRHVMFMTHCFVLINTRQGAARALWGCDSACCVPCRSRRYTTPLFSL